MSSNELKYFICLDNYLSKELCDSYINFYNSNLDRVYEYEDSYPIILQSNELHLIQNIIKDFNINYKLDKVEIIKRENDSIMNDHIDYGDKLSFILYLNDDYDGGETLIENKTIIEPKTGRILLFTNGNTMHRVNKVLNGTRFVMIGWFV